MKKIHLACGDIYLTPDYINCDIVGLDRALATQEQINANITTLDNYFKYPFIEDPIERKKYKRPFIIDKHMDILQKWDFEDNSIDEVVLISAWEHFHRFKEIPHIVKELNRIIKIGGKFLVDFPNIKKQVELYYDTQPELCAELIYCNDSNEYSRHRWMYNEKTFPEYLGKNWSYNFRDIVLHSYPMIGVECTKIST